MMHHPRILVVSRRGIRKDKYINYVGEYHLDLLVQHKALPIIVPRVANVLSLLDSLSPIHGLLLTEGEDIGPDFVSRSLSIAHDLQEAVLAKHPSDAMSDGGKDSIEFKLVRRCLRDGIPILAICRGAQLVNVACGGHLYTDVEIELRSNICHIDYNNYDSLRHPIEILENTPLCKWFDGASRILVNSYHHQGIAVLASRFRPMAFAPDGLIEAYYDPAIYDPQAGRFLVGLQFHPERMQDIDIALTGHPPLFDYPGCVRPYTDFVEAASAFRAHSVAMRRAFRTSFQNTRVFSKDELTCIMRSGATIHGGRLIRNILDKENSLSQADADKQTPGNDSRVKSQAKHFRSRLHHVQRTLHFLKRDEDINEAHSLLNRLCELVSVDSTAPIRSGNVD